MPVPGPEPEQRGRVIASKDTVFLEPGRTRKSEVVERLGSPDVIWETENVLVYHSNRVVGRVLWAVPFGYAASVGLTDVSEKHVLLIDFDDSDVVRRFELVERGPFESLGELLRRWHPAPGKEPL